MLKAEYTESPLISFDTGTDNDDELPAYDPPEPQIYTGNQFVLTSEVPERPGYEFIGWKYGNDSTLFSRGSSNFRLPAGETAATLVAQWRKQTQMTLKYVNPNGSIVQSLNRIVKYGEPYANNYINNINGMPQVEDIDQIFDISDTSTYYANGFADETGKKITSKSIVEIPSEHVIQSQWIPKAHAIFTDVSDNWANKGISICKYYGYMSGVSETEFGSENPVTRAQAVTVLYRMEGSPSAGNNDFYDVPTYSGTDTDKPTETSNAVSWADKNGIASGVNTTIRKFEPEGELSRQQMVRMLYGLASFRNSASIHAAKYNDDSVVNLNLIPGGSSVSDSYKTAMRWAYDQKIISGKSGGNLAPADSVTRAEYATFIMRLKNLFDREDEQKVLRTYQVDDQIYTISVYPQQTYTLISDIPVRDSGIFIGWESGGRLYGAGETIDEPNADMKFTAVWNHAYSSKLEENSWAQIQEVSRLGRASALWNIGDEKVLTLSTGERVTLQIYGFDQDNLTVGGKAGITFGLKNIMSSARRMDMEDSNSDSFIGTDMYDWLNGSLYQSMPAELRSAIKSVDKKTSVGAGSTQTRTDSMKIFLFSETECFGRIHHSAVDEGNQYPIFTDDASRIKT